MARRFDPEDLARWLDAVSLLDGRLVHCRQGPCLIWPRHVTDPRPLVDLGDELPTRRQLRDTIAMKREPVELTARRLGRIQRDIKRLRSPEAQAAVAEAHRRFRRHGRIDDARLDERQAELDALSARWQRPDEPQHLLRVLIGAEAFPRLERLVDRWRRGPRRALRRRRLHLQRLVVAIEEGGHAIVALGRLPGRARLRRLFRAVADELSIETHDLHVEPPPGWRFDRSLAEQARIVGDWLIGERHRRLLADGLSTKAARVLRCFALLFELDADAPRRLSDADVLRLVSRRLGVAAKQLAGTGLTCSQALDLLAVPKLSESYLRPAAAWIQEGIPVEILAQLAERRQIHQLERLSAEQRAAYARWTTELAGHYAAHGIALDLEPEDFGELAEAYGARRAARDMALVARCLIHHHQRGERAVPQLLTLLDSTLALFRGLPSSLREVVARIAHRHDGLGRTAHPDFAAWLGDDALVDRYLSLLRLVDGHTDLSKRARRDFVRGKGTWPPSKTRRWLAKRADQLAARAYDQLLDGVIARLVEERFGVPALDVDESWRNALRMQLLGGRNQDRLAELLALVARGGDLAELPANAAWLEAKRETFDVEAWLLPHDERVVIGGTPYRLHTEERPLEVLPMGIPFDTCLSLHDGFNAPSAILNAIDVNKRVIYLRRESGAIVARKLVAVSTNDELVGFRVYSSLDASLRSVVEGAVDRLAARIAEQAGLPLSMGGDVERLHEGFWYDDGPVSFATRGGRGDALLRYAEALSRPVPSHLPANLVKEAHLFAAAARGRAVALGHRNDRGLLARHVVDAFTPDALLTAARADHGLARAAFATVRRAEGAEAAVRWATPFAEEWVLRDDLSNLLRIHPPSPALAEALIDVAEASLKRGDRVIDHGLCHDTFYVASRHVARLPPSRFLACAERLAVLWDRVLEDTPGCADCRRIGDDGMQRAILASYAAQPDPDAILRILRAKRRPHPTTRRLALAVAARHVLGDRASDGCREVPGVRRVIGTVVSRFPELEGDPLVLAAWLRHCGDETSTGLCTLPAVTERPFDALADLNDRFPAVIAASMAAFGDSEPTSAWDWQHHRRHPTSYRRRLRERHEAGDRGPRSEVARRLASLGDVEALTEGSEAGLRAAAAAARVQGDHHDVSAALAVWRQARQLDEPAIACWIHPRALEEAWAGLEARDEVDPRDDVVRFVAEVTPLRELAERVDRLWPSAAATALAERAIKGVGPYVAPLSPRTMIGMWNEEHLRSSMAEALGRVGTDEVLEGLIDAAEDEMSLFEMLAAWTAAERFEDDVLPLERDATMLARVAPRLVEQHPAQRWVPAYLALSDALGASRFLDAIATASFSRVDARRHLDRVEDPRQPHATWLAAELDRVGAG